MKRSELISDTRRLIAEGERLQQSPSVVGATGLAAAV